MEKHNRYCIVKNILVGLVLMIFLQVHLNAQDQLITLSNGKKIILYSDKTWDHFEKISYNYDFSKLTDNNIPDFLRQEIDVDKQTLKIAVKMYLQGWRYTMPIPKSTQASWGNHDGRTT